MSLNAFGMHHTLSGSSIVFLRGFASPQWLNMVGDIHRVTLSFTISIWTTKAFAPSRYLFSSPSLPSSSARIFQLTIPTICVRNIDGGYEPEDLQQTRKTGAEKMKEYF